MKRIPLTPSVYESDLDMARATQVQRHAGLVRRLFDSILGNPQNFGTIDKPRRVIDREQQQYSRPYE